MTIVGFGGMGKTRLALQVAAELADGAGDGVWFVDLSAITDPEQVPAAIATVLGVVESTDGVLAAVVRYLKTRRLLLVLDNLEQLLPDAAAALDGVIRAGPDVRILATSREPLRLSGENEYVLSSLPFPPGRSRNGPWTDSELASLSTYDAVRLFIRRAAAVRRGFVLAAANASAIAAICARLDGMPLALELAAARTRSLSPEALLPRLDHALTILVGGSRDLPSRQQTIRATIAWSYDALEPNEQQLLDRLSVFSGTFALPAVQAICGPALGNTPVEEPDGDLDVLNGLDRLVDRSLVTLLATDGTSADRYSLLVSIREYAADQLDRSGGTTTLRDRHARYFTDLVAERPDRLPADEDHAWEVSETELLELRTALTHLGQFGAMEGETTLAWHVAGNLMTSGLLTEARSVIDQALHRTAPVGAAHIALLIKRSIIEWNAARPAESTRFAVKALAEARELGEASLIAAALGASEPRTRAEGLIMLAEGDALRASLPPFGTYLPRWEVDDHWQSVKMLHIDPHRTEIITRESFDANKATEGPLAGLNLAYVLLARGRLEEARELLAPLERPPEESTSQGAGIALYYAAMMRLATGDPALALRDLDHFERYLRRVEMPGWTGWAAILRAAAQRASGDRPGATDTLTRILEDQRDLGPGDLGEIDYLRAVLSRESGDRGAAAQYLAQAWTIVGGWDARHLDLILECMLERATQVIRTDPRGATDLIGLVMTHRGDFIPLHGVPYDTEAMLVNVRGSLGAAEVDQILSDAATMHLPDDPDLFGRVGRVGRSDTDST